MTMIPFHLYLYSKYLLHMLDTGTNQVRTRALSIKTMVAFGNLLHELFLCMATTKTDNQLLKYIPISMESTLGPEPYKQLICANNAYLTSVATIPVIRIPDEALKLCIETCDAEH